PCGEPLEGGHLLADGARERRYAGADFLAVEQDRTGPALGKSTTELRSGQLKIVSQDIEQRGVVGRLDLTPRAIDADGGHENPPSERFQVHLSRNRSRSGGIGQDPILFTLRETR